MICPVCRASNNDVDPACRRCRADLWLLVALEAERRDLLAQAAAQLAAGEPSRSFEFAEKAHDLRQAADSARIIALAQLVAGNFAAAWQWYNEATKY